MIPDRAPTTLWILRNDGDPFGASVRTLPDDRILIDSGRDFISFTRADARLLAKRINQCLDATVKS